MTCSTRSTTWYWTCQMPSISWQRSSRAQWWMTSCHHPLSRSCPTVCGGMLPTIAAVHTCTRYRTEPNTTVGQVRAKCKSHLGARHAAERLLRCWGSGAGLFHGETKDAIGRVVEEYVASRDLAECARCLQTLAVPWFHHELVKQVRMRGACRVCVHVCVHGCMDAWVHGCVRWDLHTMTVVSLL